MWYQWLISLPMMVCLFWCVYFFIRCMERSREANVRYSILLFYLASTVLYTNHWLYFSGVTSFIGSWSYAVANLSVYPLYYAYLLALTRKRNRNELYILLIPAAVMLVFCPFNRFFGWIDQPDVLLPARICFAIQVVWVWYRGGQLVRNTCRTLDDTYADNRSYLLKPTHILLGLISVTAASSILLNILGSSFFAGNSLIAVPAVIMSLLLYLLGYVAAHTVLPPDTVAQPENPEEDRATTEETDELMNRIATALREKRLFANPHLTIQDLAAAVGSNRTYVSNCINRRTGLSFSQYVARYRVEHAQLILRTPQYMSDHEAIADAVALSGFSSDQSFYRVFKEVTGITPLQYRRQNLSKD